MVNLILKMKHWQLFVLLIGVPLTGNIFMTSQMIADNDPSASLRFFPVLMIVTVVVLLGSFYAWGTGLHKRLPAMVKMNLSVFYLFLVIPAVYMVGVSVLMLRFMTRVSEGSSPGLHPPLWIFLVTIALHLFSMFCLFYCIYFIAKALKSIELKRPVTFSDFVGEFFLIWFFPVGVWILQPRINKIAAQPETDTYSFDQLPEQQY